MIYSLLNSLTKINYIKISMYIYIYSNVPLFFLFLFFYLIRKKMKQKSRVRLNSRPAEKRYVRWVSANLFQSNNTGMPRVKMPLHQQRGKKKDWQIKYIQYHLLFFSWADEKFTRNFIPEVIRLNKEWGCAKEKEEKIFNNKFVKSSILQKENF